MLFCLFVSLSVILLVYLFCCVFACLIVCLFIDLLVCVFFSLFVYLRVVVLLQEKQRQQQEQQMQRHLTRPPPQYQDQPGPPANQSPFPQQPVSQFTGEGPHLPENTCGTGSDPLDQSEQLVYYELTCWC